MPPYVTPAECNHARAVCRAQRDRAEDRRAPIHLTLIRLAAAAAIALSTAALGLVLNAARSDARQDAQIEIMSKQLDTIADKLDTIIMRVSP